MRLEEGRRIRPFILRMRRVHILEKRRMSMCPVRVMNGFGGPIRWKISQPWRLDLRGESRIGLLGGRPPVYGIGW